MNQTKETSMVTFSDTERAILLGSLLGDSTIQKRDGSYRYRIAHSEKQINYVHWLYSKLERLCEGMKPPTKRLEDDHPTVEFYLKSGLYLKEMFNLFYKKVPSVTVNGEEMFVKTITPELIDKLPMNPILLAVWYMDDGSKRDGCDGCNLATQSFTRDENLLLANYLKKWNLECHVNLHSRVKNQYYLYISAKSFPRFREIIGPTVNEIPDMTYKIRKHIRKDIRKDI